MKMYVLPRLQPLRRPSGASRRLAFVACSTVLAALFAGGSVHGQPTAPGSRTADPAPPADEPAVVLSPFVVAGTSDVGYEATESLAGTGLATKLTDLGASVSVVTSKFFEDTGSKDLRDVLVYQANMEVTGFGGNLSGASPSLGGVTSEPSLGNGPQGTRVRGLASATQARNFYRAIIPMDGYNTDRVEINRGANALLFGVGSPAGIINSSTADADLRRSSTRVEVSGGSYGSFRGSVNANHVVRPGELAFRVAAVTDNESYQQKFAFTDTDRVYVAGAWDVAPLRNRGILTSTVLRASFENGRIRSNNPRVLTPSDRYSSWFDETLPDELKALGARGKVSYNPTVGPFNIFNRAQGNATIGVIQNVNRSPTFFFQDVTATAPRDNVQSYPGQVVLGRPLVSNNMYYPSTGLRGVAVGAYSRETIRVAIDYGLEDSAFYTSENMSDRSVFDFFDNLLAGPNSEALSNLRSVDASLQQLFLKGKAGVELAFNRQNWDQSQQDLMSQSSPYISIDVNTHMFTGEVNPNYGRPFISTAGDASYGEQEIETTRAKAFYEFNFEDRFQNRLGGILGRHVASVLAQREVFETRSHGGGSLFYTPDLWPNGNNQSRTAAQSKQVVAWVYLGPSLANASSARGANLPGLQENLMNFHEQVNGQGVILSRVPAPNAASATQPAYNVFTTPINVLREDRRVTNTASGASLNERTLDSQAFSFQSNWLWDHLVSTVGWRKEESSIIGLTAPTDPNGEGYRLVDDPTFRLDNPTLVPQRFEETLFAWSVVAKAPEKILRRIPGISRANLFYGESENFSPPSGRTVDTFGREIPPPAGITKEQGLYLEAFNGKISARLNFYETTQTGSFNGTLASIPGSIVGQHSAVYNMVRNGSIPDAGNGFPPGYVAPPQALLDLFQWRIQNGTPASTNPGVQDTSDFVTKGSEFELMFRPTRGLSFIANVSEQESVRSNSGAATRQLLFNTPTSTGRTIAEEWRSPWAFQIPLNVGALGNIGSPTDQNILANGFQLNSLNRYNAAVAADGAPAHELRKWRFNFVANYDVQGDRFRGFGVGGAVRWLDKAAIGYPVATFRSDLTPVPPGGAPELGDIRVSDPNNPFYGPTETRYDAWISYSRKLMQGKIDWKIQLNVRNLFTKDELIPVAANPDGTVAVWSIAEGRKFTITSRFSF